MASNHPTGQDRQTSGTTPARDDKPNPAPPEQTNYAHPTAPGLRTAVEGEGIVSTDTARRASRDTPDDQRGTRGKAPNDPNAPETPVEPPSGSAGPAARETSDPNFTAASRPRSDFAGTSSMNPDAMPNRQGGRQANPTHVRDLMSKNVEVATPDTDLYYVARMMAERDIGAVPIVDSTDTMRPLGILTDRDIVVRVIAKNQSPDELKAGQVMTPSATTVRPDTPLDDAVREMTRHQIRRILVTDGQNRVIGLISQGDLATRGPQQQAAELLRETGPEQQVLRPSTTNP
jgi:CBS domain-containing protein